MRTTITILAAAALLATAGAATAAPATAASPVCHEDMPCWDATTMGNRQVGATVVDHEADGSPIVSCPRPGAIAVFVNEPGHLICQY